VALKVATTRAARRLRAMSSREACEASLYGGAIGAVY
jgi:hypothetical protein